MLGAVLQPSLFTCTDTHTHTQSSDKVLTVPFCQCSVKTLLCLLWTSQGRGAGMQSGSILGAFKKEGTDVL